MSELYINLPQLKKVPAELSGTPQDIRRKIQSLESIEQYVKSQISGGGELQRQLQSIREELERIAGSVSSYGDALQQICGVYETCEEGIGKCGLSSYSYANAKESGGEDVPWYRRIPSNGWSEQPSEQRAQPVQGMLLRVAVLDLMNEY